MRSVEQSIRAPPGARDRDRVSAPLGRRNRAPGIPKGSCTRQLLGRVRVPCWLESSDHCTQLLTFQDVHLSKLITVLILAFANLVAGRHSRYNHVANNYLKLLVYLVCIVMVSLTSA